MTYQTWIKVKWSDNSRVCKIPVDDLTQIQVERPGESLLYVGSLSDLGLDPGRVVR